MRFESVWDAKEKKLLPGHPVSGLEKMGNTRKRGTLVRFLPDDAVFEETNWNAEQITRRLRELAYLNKKAQISLTDERAQSSDHATAEYCYEGGIADYVRYLDNDKTPLHADPIVFDAKRDGIELEVAMQYTDAYTESIFSYVNNIPTAEGGTHETGFRAALTKAFNDYARKIGALKDKDLGLSGEDFREGLTALLSIKVRNPQFEGQTKGRLGNTEVRPAVEAMVGQKLQEFLEDLKNAELGQQIIEKSLRAARVREASRKAREVARAKNALEAAPLVGKLSAVRDEIPWKTSC